MAGLNGNRLLTLWELGRRRHPLDRALLLHAAALGSDEVDASSLADQPLGRRNAALLELHQSWLGGSLEGAVECPSCSERLEFKLSAPALMANPGRDVLSIEVDGFRVRLPTTRDLAAIAREPDADAAARRLTRALLDTDLEEAALAELAPRIEAALDAADPCADVALGFSCPSCSATWTSSFDVASYVWDEVEVRSRQLLDEVHVLATAYGWGEGAILELSGGRRTAYLERVLG